MKESVVTRYAPTISGDLHLGGLYNCLLNYLYAKQNNGLFKLRLDGTYLNPDRQRWQDNLQRDLELFSFFPDEVLKQSDRMEAYYKATEDLEKSDRSYYCNCTVQDSLKRASIDSSKFYHIHRPEKYPTHCQICQIKVYGTKGEENIAEGCKVKASHEAMNHAADTLTCRQPNPTKYWEPIDRGYAGNPLETKYVTIILKEEIDVRGVEIVWRDKPALHYEITSNTRQLAECKKNGEYFYEHKQGQPYLTLQSDQINFAPYRAKEVTVAIHKCPKFYAVPYFYDGHCRDRKLQKLDLQKSNNTLRLKFDSGIYSQCTDIVTGEAFPQKGKLIEADPALWLKRYPDLVLTSPVDDARLGITHHIRGIDIKPWFAIEGQVAYALNVLVTNIYYHSLIVDKRGYKYGKFVKSKGVREYLKNGITPNMITSYLAFKTGLIPEYRTLTVEELITIFNLSNVTKDNVVINEDKMIEELGD